MIPLATTVRLRYEAPKAIIGIIVGTLAWFIFIQVALASDWISPDTGTLLTVYRYNDPDPLRAIAAIFSHATPWHWAGNMIFLWVFGAPLEDRLGWKKFLALFVVCGLLAILFQTLLFWAANWNAQPVPVSGGLGSSGAIFGIMGLTMRRFPRGKVVLGISPGIESALLNLKVPLGWFVGYRAVAEFFQMGANDNIGHLAHLLGFGVGFASAGILHLRKEGENEILLDQAQELYDRGWFPQGLERLDRLVAKEPGQARFRVLRAQCLFKMWPKQGHPGERLRKQVLDELETALSLFMAANDDEAAWRLYHEFIPPFQPAEFSEKARHVMQLWQGRFSLNGLRAATAQEHGDSVASLKAAVLAQMQAGDQAGAAEDMLALLKVGEVRNLEPELVRLGYIALKSQSNAQWIPMAELSAEKHPEVRHVLQALQDLERVWKNTPKQPRLGDLIRQAEVRHLDLELDPRVAELKERLKRV